jgi:hypothetical protein
MTSLALRFQTVPRVTVGPGTFSAVAPQLQLLLIFDLLPSVKTLK